MANFKRYSRYTNGSIDKNRSGINFLILRKPLNLKEDSTDLFVTIGQDLLKRPELISSKAYGIPDLWWAIYEYNGIKDPLFDLKLGQVLKIPELSRLINAIQKINT
jgi:hypothetical protein